MIVAWRAPAERVLEAAVPIPDDLRLDEDWVNRRAALRSVLKLDAPLLRLPLLALGVLAPIVTSLFAVFLPELAP